MEVGGSSNVSEDTFAALWDYVKQLENRNRLAIGDDFPPFTPHDVFKDWLATIFPLNASVLKDVGQINRSDDQTRRW